MTDTSHIRRRPDGSIDTAYYTRQGRARRSAAAREMAGAATRSIPAPVFGLAGPFARVPLVGAHR
jgi:hypothetical protein